MIDILQRSLKTRVTLATLVIFVLSLWALGYITTRMLRTDMEHQLGEQQFSTASLVAANIEQEMQTRMSALERLAARFGRSNLLDKLESLQTDLEDRQVMRMLFNGGYFITDAAGTATASVPLSVKRAGVNHMHLNHVAGALREGKSTISEIFIGKQLTVPVVSIATPIRDAGGRVVGSLVGVIDLASENFLDKITANPYGRTGGFMVVSRQQRQVITATDKSRIMEKLPPAGANRMIDRFLQGYEGSAVYINPKGEEVLTSVRGIPLAGWYVATTLPTVEALAPVHDMQRRMLITTLLFTLLAGGITWWWLRRQLAPIGEVANAISERLVAGKTTEPLAYATQDEIGQLINGFNQLLAMLQTNETRLGAIAAMTSDLIYSCSRSDDGLFRIDWLSGNTEPMFGVTTHELIERGCWRPFVIEADLPLFTKAITVLQPGQSSEQVMRIVCRDGSIRWVESIARVEDEPGNAARHRLVGALRDISEKIQTREALREQETFFRLTAENIGDFIAVLDLEGRRLYNSPSYQRFFGDGLELRGSDSFKEIHPDDRESIQALFQETVRTGIGREANYRLITPDGVIHYMESRGSAIADDAGRPLRVVVVSRDVTERRLAELALLDSETQLKQAQRMAVIGNWTLYLPNGPLRWSDEIFRIFEIDPTRFPASYEAFLACIHPDDRDPVDRAYRHSLETREPYSIVHRLLFPDGRIKHVHERCETDYGPDGQPLRSRGTVQDISERVLVEHSLRDSEQRFRNLADNSADWIWALDLDGRHTYSNCNIAAILGYTPEEFLPIDTVSLVHPDDIELFGATFAAAQASLAGWRNVVIRWRHKDGSYRLLESSAAPILDDQGDLLGFHGVDRDITERVRAEQERKRLASILEVTSDIVSMADPQGNLIYLNGPGRALMGIAPDGALPEVIPKVHPRWAADLILDQGVPTAIRNGVWSGETAVLGPVGQEIPVSQVILSHKDTQGQLLYLSTIMRDIRPLLAAEQAMRDSEERLRLALAAASQGLYDLDLSTGDAQVTPEYASMLGYDPATFKETSAAWRERLHPDDQATVDQVYADYVAGRLLEYRVECRQRTRDGGWKWVLSLGRVQEWSDDGRPLRMLGTHTDIDAIKAAEAALRELNASLEARVAQRTAELHALNQSLESFVYSVSHDLKTPLRGIEGYSRLLEEDYADRLDDEGRLFIGNIRGGVARMGELIDDLLAYSRMERKSLASVAIDPETLVRQWLAERATTLAELTISTQVELPGVAVLADPDGLAMVLRNLLENAFKFSTKMESPRIEIGGRVEQDDLIVWVRDNGIGFDMKYHDRIFEIFQRLHRLEDYPGTGIGLALVKKAMQRMGGRVWAESAPGQGATFFLCLPRSSN